MGRLVFFWVDLDTTCVVLEIIVVFLVWKKNCSQSAKRLNISVFR